MKQCPFCGNPNVEVRSEIGETSIAATEHISNIYCDVCGCTGPKSRTLNVTYSKKVAEVLWNNRNRESD